MRALPIVVFLAMHGIYAFAAVSGRSDRGQIVFGYMQNVDAQGPMLSYRWHALTHVAYTGLAFTSTGEIAEASKAAWRARSPELKKGGAAHNNGVRVIMVLTNHRFDPAVRDAAFSDVRRRSRLVQEAVAVVTDPQTGCDGITLDIEPMNFPPTVARGYWSFVRELAQALHALSPPRELSMYLGTFRKDWFDAAISRDSFDYIIYSGYDFAEGKTVADTGFIGSIEKGIDSWLAVGMPAEKIVLALPLYGHFWEVRQPVWGASGKNGGVQGMDAGNHLATLLEPPLPLHPSGPQRSCVFTAETIADSAYRVRAFDDMESHVRKLRMAKSWTGKYQHGKPLAGVGFWSLLWLAQARDTGSIDPNDPAQQMNRKMRRTFSSPWTAWEQEFAPAGTKYFRAETFEALTLDPRWTAPVDSPDTSSSDPASNISSAPAPPGSPAGSDRVAQLQFRTTAPNARVMFRYKPLLHTVPPYKLDTGSSLVLVPASAAFTVPVFVPNVIPGASLRLVVSDGRNELECSPPLALTSTGVQIMTWPLNNAQAVHPFTTRESCYRTGNGRIDSTAGQHDIAFVGFVIECPQPAAAVIGVDSILYTLNAGPGL